MHQHGKRSSTGSPLRIFRGPLTLFLPLLLLAVAGCAPTYRDLPSGSSLLISDDSQTAVVEKQSVTITPPVPEPPPEADYRIGVNDVLHINISGRPEFQVTPSGGTTKVSGSRVDGSGRVTLPLAGPVQVSGLTLAEAQARIREALKVYLKEPWVVVEVVEYKSKPLYLMGAFRSSGTYYIDRPLTLLQGMSLGGGFDGNANIRSARLSRDGKIQPVDIFALLTGGDQRQNVWLKPGDTIYLPDKSYQQVFVFGSVRKPGPVAMLNSQLNLAQAIATVELYQTGYDLAHVRIIRSHSPTRGELIVVDFDRIMRGRALPFMLQEGDIVYVPRSQFGSWNDAIAEMLPTLQAIGAVLQPFVNIKYLGGF